MASPLRRGSCGSRPASDGRRAQGHDVRHTGTLLPPRQNAALQSGVIQAGIRRVVIAQQDPFPEVRGGGLAELRAAGIEVEVGLLEAEARRLNAPYLKLLETGRPWVIAKWAMTLDGKTASRVGSSRWISNPQSREIVHALRGRVDAIVVGRETARLDDPLLTARPPGPRTALRVVVDTRGTLALDSQLVRTAREVPLMVAVGPEFSAADRQAFEAAGCEVFVCQADSHQERLQDSCAAGPAARSNILDEGGGRLTGAPGPWRNRRSPCFIAPS